MSHLAVIRSTFQAKFNLELSHRQQALMCRPPGEIKAADNYNRAHGLPDLGRLAQIEAADIALDAAIDAARRAKLTTPLQIQAALRRAGVTVVDGLPALRACGPSGRSTGSTSISTEV